jgi:hypothetical protein
MLPTAVASNAQTRAIGNVRRETRLTIPRPAPPLPPPIPIAPPLALHPAPPCPVPLLALYPSLPCTPPWQVLLDVAWRSAFEPIQSACDGVYALPLPPSTSSVQLPPLALALRDRRGLAASLPDSAALIVTLLQPPSGCSTTVQLEGHRAVRIGTASVGTFSNLALRTSDGAVCAGAFALRVELRDWPRHMSVDEQLEQQPVAPARLHAALTVRLVSSLNYSAARESTWGVDMPPFINISNMSSMTRTASTVTYVQVSRLHSITTTVTTNITTVGVLMNQSDARWNASRQLSQRDLRELAAHMVAIQPRERYVPWPPSFRGAAVYTCRSHC